MFGTIRKHQSWLWVIIIGVTCLSMVIYFQPGQRNGQGGSGDFGAIDNKAITVTEMQNARNEASLMYFMQAHEWPDSPGASKRYDLDTEAYKRLFLLRRLDDYNIHADPDTAAQLAGVILRQLGQGQGQAVPLDAFVEQVLKPHNLTAEDFQRFLEHDVAIQQLVAVIGASGKLVTPAEIQSLYVAQYQEVSADAVFFSASNYLAKIPDPTPDALARFYTNQMATYRQPDEMQLKYVFFNETNFIPQAEKQIGTNLTRMAEEAFSRLGTNIARLGKTPEEAHAKIKELILQETAQSNAYVQAVAFQNETVKGPVRAENLDTAAKQKNLEVKVTKPFEKEYGPGELNLGSGYPVASLFNLTADEPFVDSPLRGTDGVYVLAYDKLIPSRIPPLSEIHSRVISDYKYLQAMRLAQINGQSFAQTATNELAHGKTFAATCTATGVKPVEVPPFSFSSQRMPEVEDHADIGAFKEIALTNSVGSVSGFIETREGGFVVHVKQRLPIDQAKMNADLPDYSKAVRQRRETEAFELWFNQEGSRALRNIPLFQRPAGAAR